MKINDQQQKLLDAYAQTQAAQQTQQQQQQMRTEMNAQQGSDKVQLSSSSKFLQRVNEAMKASDPQRAEKVQAIKQQVQSGTYEVNPEKVANAMMKDLLKDLG